MVSHLAEFLGQDNDDLDAYKEYQDFFAERLPDDSSATSYLCTKHNTKQGREVLDDRCHLALLLEELDEYEFYEAHPNSSSKAYQASRQPLNKYQARQQKLNKKKSLEKRGKLLIYSKLDSDTQKQLDESRKSEWANYMRFKAITKISKTKALQLLNSGVEALPMQWVEVNKIKAYRPHKIHCRQSTKAD